MSKKPRLTGKIPRDADMVFMEDGLVLDIRKYEGRWRARLGILKRGEGLVRERFEAEGVRSRKAAIAAVEAAGVAAGVLLPREE